MNDEIQAWEYPEDDWIRMGDNFDMNMWTDDINGKMRISIYAVRNGQTDAVFPLSSYQVIKTKNQPNLDLVYDWVKKWDDNTNGKSIALLELKQILQEHEE